MTSDVSQKPSARISDPPSRQHIYLLYHEISADPGRYKYALDQGSFRKHLELLSRVREEQPDWLWPDITFDDGHASNVEYALPLLCEFNITAHFFITVGWTSERPEYLTWEQIEILQRAGHKIGAHGWSHTLLTHCSRAELERELSDARRRLENRLGTSVTAVSLPGGRMNRQVLEACRQSGYEQVFTSIPKVERSDSSALVGRVNLRTDVTTEWLEELLRPGSQLIERMERTYRIKEAAQRALGDRLYSKLWALLNRASAGAPPA